LDSLPDSQLKRGSLYVEGKVESEIFSGEVLREGIRPVYHLLIVAIETRGGEVVNQRPLNTDIRVSNADGTHTSFCTTDENPAQRGVNDTVLNAQPLASSTNFPGIYPESILDVLVNAAS
jgi:hypothetical protein